MSTDFPLHWLQIDDFEHHQSWRFDAVARRWEVPSHSHQSIWKDVQYAGGQAGIKTLLFQADTPDKIESSFAAMVNSHSDGVIVALDSFFAQQQSQIANLALKGRLPSIATTANFVEAGLLMSYGQDLAENFRRAATYCDQILKGASPADIPVEQPTCLEFVINNKTARLLGIVPPGSILLRADRLIE